MELNKNLRSTIKPSNDLYRKDIKSKFVNVPTGVFNRNCVLTGKHSPDMTHPLYIRTPGIISPVYRITPEGLGHFEASEDDPYKAIPTHNAVASNSNYWTATVDNAYISYCHPVRPTTIRSYMFITISGYTPNAWRVEGSNDNISWEQLHRVEVSWTWLDGKNIVQYDIPLENRAEYKYHRLVIETHSSSSTRIYYLQFFDALCPTTRSFYLDADEETPLQLAFANGYNPDGTPNDILYTINSPMLINIEDIFDMFDLTNVPIPLPCALFAEYDPNEHTVSFKPELAIAEQPMLVSNYNILSYDVSSFGSQSHMFYNNSSYTAMWNSGEYVLFSLTVPAHVSKFYLRTNTGTCKIQISEDFGSTWEDAGLFNSTVVKVFTFNRVYYVTQIRISRETSLTVYYFALCQPDSVNYKLSQGKIYQYNLQTGAWHQKYKLPLGSFNLWYNPDGTQLEIGQFIPTLIPQMSVAPYFTKTTQN